MGIPLVYNHVAWQPEWGTCLGDDISGHDIADGGLGSTLLAALICWNLVARLFREKGPEYR